MDREWYRWERKENYVCDLRIWEWYEIEEEMSWKILLTIYWWKMIEGTRSLYENITNKKTQVPIIGLHVSKSGPPFVCHNSTARVQDQNFTLVIVMLSTVKSPTSDKWWSDNVFISGGQSSPHKPVLWGCVRPNHHF